MFLTRTERMAPVKKPSVVVLGILLCAYLPALASAQATTRVKKSANEISLEEMADPTISARSVLDAVQRLRPNWMKSRGSTSFRGGNAAQGGVSGSCRGGNCSAISTTPGTDAPGVILNELKQPFETLRSIKANEVTSLKYLSAQDATTRYGTGFPQGVILISTVAVQR